MSLWTVGHLTVDDVVLPDGTTRMGTVGGAAVYAAVGARLAGFELGIITRLGSDYPASSLNALEASGLPLRLTPVAGRCLWQWAIYEHDGSRTFLPHPDSGGYPDTSPEPDDEVSWDRIEAVHVAPMPVRYQRPWVTRCEASDIPVHLDPHHDSSADEPQQIQALIPSVKGFLPSQLEVDGIDGGEPVEAAAGFVAAGAKLAVTKLGAAGCVVATADRCWRVPAYPVTVADPTGAGDSFCGAFLGATHAGHAPEEAAVYGTVAASFVLERFGALAALEHADHAAFRRRMEAVQPRPLDHTHA